MPKSSRASGKAALRKAIVLHEEHLEKPKTATARSQRELMTLIRKGYRAC